MRLANRLVVGSVLLLLVSGCGSTACDGPADCDGNPCCWEASVLGQSIACTTSPSGCVPFLGVDTITTRVCHSDADCSAGISTALAHCCQRSEPPSRACLEECP